MSAHFCYIRSRDAQRYLLGEEPYLRFDAEEEPYIRAGMLVEFALSGRKKRISDWRLLDYSGGVHRGVIKFIHDQGHYAFIDCDATFKLYNQDVFVGEKCTQGLRLFAVVVFRLTFSDRGHPQAEEVTTISDTSVPDVRLVEGSRLQHTYGKALADDDLVVIPDFFHDSDSNMFSAIRDQCVWKLRVGQSHQGVLNPTSIAVHKVCQDIQNYFQITIANVAVNYYTNGRSFKPFHKDKYQSNESLTVIASFGDTRCLTFRHCATHHEKHFQQHNGTVTVFCGGINRNWEHGVAPSDVGSAGGRISISVWGISAFQVPGSVARGDVATVPPLAPSAPSQGSRVAASRCRSSQSPSHLISCRYIPDHAVITAKYPGSCEHCSLEIQLGDQLAKPNGTSSWMHRKCAERLYYERR